jgi:hypothetical protein
MQLLNGLKGKREYSKLEREAPNRFERGYGPVARETNE